MHQGSMSDDRTPRLRAVPNAVAGAERAAGPLAVDRGKNWDGLIAPSRRGSSSRFLTDVIV